MQTYTNCKKCNIKLPEHEYVGLCDNCYILEKTAKPTNEAEARQYAIDWQNWQAEKSLSYGELASWQAFFTDLGNKFNLTEEFKENGII